MERSGPRLWANRREQEILLSLLRRVREEKGFSQVELARRLSWPQTRVSRYEVGARRLDLLELRAVCKALSISLVDLVRTFDSDVSRSETKQRSANRPDKADRRRL